MLLTEEEIKTIILEETIQYLEEIKGKLGPEKFQQFLQKRKGVYEKGYVPFTKPHRAAAKKAGGAHSAWEVYIMVLGDVPGRGGEPALKDWPDSPRDREVVKQYLNLHGYSENEPWRTVQRLVLRDLEEFKKQQKQLAEIVKEEIIKHLKENE